LTDKLIEEEGQPAKVLNQLPLRDRLAPSREALFDFSTRPCCGGFGLVVAIARPDPHNDYVIPVQYRSTNVTNARGLCAVIPKAFHSAAVGADEEVNVFWSAMREFYEELHGGNEVKRHQLPNLV
jgi:hypothetical protein